VLAESDSAGVHLAVSEDLFRVVYFQGHPEYDTISLLKEYKREVVRFSLGERPDYPPFPENYFDATARAILDEYRAQVEDALDKGIDIPEFPERYIAPRLDNTWHDTAEAVVDNWIGKVYLLTHIDRKIAFADGVDPDDPLGLRK